MFPHLIIIDDDTALMGMMKQDLQGFGFASIDCVEHTDGIVDRIINAYSQPTLLICDYCVTPVSPTRYLPALALQGVEIPSVIMSGQIDAMQINELTLAYPIRGFFQKSHKAKQTIMAVAKHLVDLGVEAKVAFERYRLRMEAGLFITDLGRHESLALLGLLGMEEVKVVAAENDLGLNPVYALRKDMLAFLGKPCVPARYVALQEALRKRLSVLG
jgi:FixJ family two-component response regulator